MLVFIIPLLFVAFCYIRIAAVVWRVTDSLNTSTSSSQNGEETFVLRRNMSRAKHGTIERSKTKAIQLTICILTCYILCWLPYFSINLLNVWTDYKFKHNIPSFLKALSKCLAWFSSCVNPIIYGGFHISFRPLTRWLFPGCRRKESCPISESKKTSVQASARSLRCVNEDRQDSMTSYARAPSIPMSTFNTKPPNSPVPNLERISSVGPE